MPVPTDAFSAMNDDVLAQIFRELHSVHCLLPLSQTCRWIRNACIPIMFSACAVTLRRPMRHLTQFTPSEFWPYIRSLTLRDWCDDVDMLGHALHSGTPPPSSLDTVLCNVFNGPLLRAVLHRLPHLSTLHICTAVPTRHGIPWSAVRFFLSLPQLQYLNVDELYIRPKEEPYEDLRVDYVAPITRFEYTLYDPRDPWKFSTEQEALGTMMRALHTSLEYLKLSAESAPISTISTLDWPHLRELTLTGERWTDPHEPIVSLFSRMPNLRALVLQLCKPEGRSTYALWPRGYQSVFPWPNLEYLAVSHPDPEDEIFIHLPPTLRTLTLRCWPAAWIQTWRNANRRTYGTYRWGFKLPLASTLLAIVRRCQAQNVQELVIEYRADNAELDLLGQLSINFPALRMLSVHSYRNEDGDNIPMERIARALASLQVRILKVHLHPGKPSLTGYNTYWPRLDSPKLEKGVNLLASIFAREIAPSVEELWLLYFSYNGPYWAPFRIVTTGEARTVVRSKSFIIRTDLRE